MSAIVLGIFVLVFYGMLWFFDSFFKSCMHYPYYAFLEGTGLKVGFFNFSWTTTAFNRFIYRWSKSLTRSLSKWFACGYFITVIVFLPVAIWTVVSYISQHLNASIPSDNLPEVKAMLPGINIPVSDFCVYFIAIGLSSIVHELGHAMAAVQEDVQILSLGLYVFTIIPIAFVQLNTDHLNSQPVYKRLRIYCAGIWHNIVIAFVSWLLFLSTPILFSVAYESNVGVRVVALTEDSPLKQARGLEVNDVIKSINNCEVKNGNDWNYCLQHAYERFGICTSEEYISQNDELVMESMKENNIVECCGKDNMLGLCFEYIEPKVPAESMFRGQYSCLKPRDMLLVQDQFERCTETNDFVCSKGTHCLKPSLNNNTYFIIINREDRHPVLYLGLPYDLYKTVMIDQYFPKFKMASFASPTRFETLLRYIFIFSMGIAFLNVLPCYSTDGHHIARNLIQILAKILNKNDDFVGLFTIITVIIGTGVTVPMLLYVFYQSVMLNE